MMLLLLHFFDKLALVGGSVHTLVAGSVAAPATILIENDQILAVGSDVLIPPDAKRVDIAGMHVLPGLIDGFVNHDPDHDRLYVDAGVTMVRDVGNDLTRILGECDRNARERSPGPWIWSCGAALEGANPSTTASVILDSVTAVEQQIPRLLEIDEIAYFSFQDTLAEPAWRRVIDLVHKAHKQVWGSAPKGVGLDGVLGSGQDGLYHLELFLPAGGRWDKVTTQDMASRVALAGAKKLCVTPTLSFYARRLLEPVQDDPELDYLGPFYVETWVRDFNLRAKLVNEEFRKTGLSILEAQSKLVKSLHDAGCRIVPGSASPEPWLMPGTGLLDELLLLRRAGIPNADVLRLATSGAAEAIGATRRGTIEHGKIADLVITTDDPEKDLVHLRKPAIVVLRGRVMPRVELDRLVDDLAKVERKVREEFKKPIQVGPLDLPSGDVILRGLVETRGVGVRVSAERYAVVRRFDGSLAYCGRLMAPGQATTPDTETTVQQTITQGELSGFEISIKSNGRVVLVKGELVAGKFSIERRLDGQFVENSSVTDKLAFVDAGSVTSALILGYHMKPGRFKVLFFEDYEPARGMWEMRLDSDGATHLVRTQSGDMKIAFDEKGGVKESLRQAGNTVLLTKSLEADAPDKRGLPMPADKRAAPKKPADGSAPKPPAKADTPPPKKAGNGG